MPEQYRPCSACGKTRTIPDSKDGELLCGSCRNTKEIVEAEAEAERKKGIPEDRNRGLRPLRF
jgi:uncharacterized Zn finger protein (UPF0148 family)